VTKTALAVAIAAVLLGAYATISTVTEHAQITQLRSRLAQAHTTQARAERIMTGQLHSLSHTVNAINVPTDPLSAYSDICNQQMTNQDSGADQTYWFPCTNQAQTIPQPGY
jgi:hypothetical protein